MAKEDGAPARRRRGRPPGIKLSPEQRRVLLSAIDAGASDHVAARLTGIDPRTFRDWRARAEGRHPTRKPTPELVELFEEIGQAKARARMRREVEVADRDPKYWLRYMARSLPGLDGWTEPVPEPDERAGPEIHLPTRQELEDMVRVLAQSLGITGRCADPGCPCPAHREASDGPA